MKRYFFDVKTTQNIQYDYRGRDFGDAQQAQQYAQLVALDVECLGGDENEAREVQVRDVRGKQLFAISVSTPGMLAA